MDDSNLEQRVSELEKWREERVNQQIVHPLDVQSQEILSRYFMRILNVINYEIVGAASHTVSLILGSQSQINFQISPQTIFPYTANVANDTLTTTSVNFANGTRVHFNATAAGSFPAPLAINTTYFVVSSSGPTFKVSNTFGGTPINITTPGSGPQYIEADLF